MNGQDLNMLRKVLGLLGSEHDGERATAARKATAMLRAAGKTWADIGFDGASQSRPDDNAAFAAAIYKMSLDSERDRTTHMAEEITRLKREVARLKGMWPAKEPA